LEFNLVRDVNGSKKGFFRFNSSKSKTRGKSLCMLLLNRIGDLTTKDIEKAAVPSTFSVGCTQVYGLCWDAHKSVK